jgi:hypothetical protein
MKHAIDDLLAPVARDFRHAADEILDLRTAVLKRSDPGDCLDCYFKIFNVAKARNPEPLRQLRCWLEENLEVVAKDGEARELERLPISLHHEDMQSFCQEVMVEFRENRNYLEPTIELSLRFSEFAVR